MNVLQSFLAVELFIAYELLVTFNANDFRYFDPRTASLNYTQVFVTPLEKNKLRAEVPKLSCFKALKLKTAPRVKSNRGNENMARSFARGSCGKRN